MTVSFQCSSNMASIDNFSTSPYMDSEFPFDLNQPPPIIDHELHNEEREIPISVMSSSSGNIIIELNENNHVVGYSTIELDLHEFRENNDGANSDSSEEEMDNFATANTNGETRDTGNGSI